MGAPVALINSRITDCCGTVGGVNDATISCTREHGSVKGVFAAPE